MGDRSGPSGRPRMRRVGSRRSSAGPAPSGMSAIGIDQGEVAQGVAVTGDPADPDVSERLRLVQVDEACLKQPSTAWKARRRRSRSTSEEVSSRNDTALAGELDAEVGHRDHAGADRGDVEQVDHRGGARVIASGSMNRADPGDAPSMSGVRSQKRSSGGRRVRHRAGPGGAGPACPPRPKVLHPPVGRAAGRAPPTTGPLVDVDVVAAGGRRLELDPVAAISEARSPLRGRGAPSGSARPGRRRWWTAEMS